MSQHQPSDIELGKHILTLNRVASNHKIDQYEIALILGQSSDFSVLIGLSNALSSTVPEGDIVLQELARGSIKSVLSANSKGFLIVVLILLKLGISVKYTGDGNFHFHLSFDGNLMVTDGKAKLQYEQHRGEISAEELERRVKKLRSSGLLPNDLRELEAQAGELSAARLPAVRSFVRQAMPHRDFSKVPPQVASASSELSELPRPSL